MSLENNHGNTSLLLGEENMNLLNNREKPQFLISRARLGGNNNHSVSNARLVMPSLPYNISTSGVFLGESNPSVISPNGTLSKQSALNHALSPGVTNHGVQNNNVQGITPYSGILSRGTTPRLSSNTLNGNNSNSTNNNNVHNSRPSALDLGLSPQDTKLGMNTGYWARSPGSVNITNNNNNMGMSMNLNMSNNHSNNGNTMNMLSSNTNNGHLNTSMNSNMNNMSMNMSNMNSNINNTLSNMNALNNLSNMNNNLANINHLNNMNNMMNGNNMNNMNTTMLSPNLSMYNVSSPPVYNVYSPAILNGTPFPNSLVSIPQTPVMQNQMSPNAASSGTKKPLRKRPASNALERPPYILPASTSNTPYQQQIGSSSYPSPLPPPAIAKATPEYDQDDILQRVKDILQRDRIKQKQLALELGFSGSTQSPILKSKYKHIKLEHLQSLFNWSKKRDSTFVQRCLARQEYFGFSRDTLCVYLGVDSQKLNDWINLNGSAFEREHIDSKLEQLFNQEMMNRLTLQHLLKDNPENLPEDELQAKRVEHLHTTCKDTYKQVQNTFPSLVDTIVPMVVSSIGDIKIYTTE